MNTLWLDLETKSTVNLPKEGVYRYAQNCNILLNSWAMNDDKVVTEDHLTVGFLKAFQAADRIVAHNAEFDRTVLEPKLAGVGQDVRFDFWYCTMSQARRHGLPGGLDKLCDILGVPADKAKLKDGRALLMLFCKPTKEGKWNTKETHPKEWARFVEYGNIDVEAMREVHRRCPKWNDEYEQAIWLVDQRINQRGFQVDTDFASKAIDLLAEEKDAVDEEVSNATDGDVSSARRVDTLLGYILAHYGVDLPDMQAATLERRIADPELPDPVRELLVLRQQSAKTSTSKYATFLRCVSKDGRLRGALTYSGAMRTKRWAGNRVQPHNMPRPSVGGLRGKALKNEIARGIDAVKAGVYDLVGTYPLSEVMASAVRGCIVARKGFSLTISDYSNIEGRGLAWLAGEGTKLGAFYDYDEGTGPDLYKLAYARAFGCSVDSVDDKQRQVGKVMELMLGYGGGVGAFVTGAATYRVDLDDLVDTAWPGVPDDVKDETAGMWQWAVVKKKTYGLPEMTFRTCDALKRMWRRAHPSIAQFWMDLEDGVRQAMHTSPVKVGLLTIDKVGAWLRIKLPSGSYISYPGIRVEDGKISYMGQNQYTRTWTRLSTYGGKIAENVTQALCRDLLAEAMLNCQEDSLHVVLHVHDELVVENREGVQDALADAMRNVEWADGLPLAVATFTTDRYHKD
jgi:DNA polymerase